MTNSPVRAFLRSLFRRKLVLVATLVLGIAFALALFAPWISPFDPGAMRVVRRLRPPNEINWFGTDELGRDIFSRIIWGARASLGIGFTAWPGESLPVFVAMMFGGTLGGNATLIGASANLVAVGICANQGSKVDFITFLRYGVPVTICQLTASALYVWALTL